MAVNKITNSSRNKIISKSVNPLPNNPSKIGYSAQDIKNSMFKFVTDEEESIVAEINRIVDEVNGMDTGKVDDVKINGSSIMTEKIANLNTKTAYNASTNKIVTEIDISGLVPNTRTVNGKELISNISLNASDVNALPDTTKYGASIDLSIDDTTYVVTAQLKDQNGNNLGTAKTIDLPLESVVVSGSYNSSTKNVVLTLKDNSTIEFSVADLVSGLQTEITTSNKLSSDLVDDTNYTHKFVTVQEKESWNNKLDKNDTQIKTDIANAHTFTREESTELGMLTWTNAQRGYICVRTDLNKTFILSQEPASNIDNWVELLAPIPKTYTTNVKKDGQMVTVHRIVNGTESNDILFTISDALNDNSSTDVLSARQGKLLNETKVDKVEGKGLSTNDYTNEEKAKLAGILVNDGIITIKQGETVKGSFSSNQSGNVTITLDEGGGMKLWRYED